MSSEKNCWLARNFDLVAVAAIIILAGTGSLGREFRNQFHFTAPAVQPMPDGVYKIRDQAREHARRLGEELRRHAAEVRSDIHSECGRLREDSADRRSNVENLRNEVREFRNQLRERLRNANRVRWE